MFRSSGEANFDKLLDRATSNLLLEVDLGAVLGITDLIRQKDCTPKYAIAAIRKKLSTPNPHVAFYALQVLEAVVKNCGSPCHEEMATKEFMEFLRELAKTTIHENVRDKILELIQTWAHAFRKLSSYRAVQDCVNIMKAEGCKFPPLVEADAMFTSDTAPEWQEGECCNRCRVQFGILNRKHHCRACGQIFCAKCSSKVCPVPKFGIEKEVRVCDSCYEKYGKPKPFKKEKAERVKGTMKGNSSDEALQAAIEASLADYSGINAQHSQVQQPRGKTEAELKEEEDLALALAISQSEAEEKEREKHRKSTGGGSSMVTPSPTVDLEDNKSSPPKKSALVKSTFEQEDPELARYLDRNYWEQRHGQTKEELSREETGTSLHNNSPSPFQPSAPVKENKNKVEQVEEMDGFMESLRASIEMFVNRMRSNSNRGRHVSNDSTVQSLFLNITSLHSQLLNYIQAQDDWRAHYESLQEKLMQAHDARDALDDLRKDYSEKQRRLAEELERQRQLQRAIKLQDMRQQKHLYLQEQRELALRRVQEEERQMQLRMEQQRLGTYVGYPMRAQGYIGQPGGQMPQGMMLPPPLGGGSQGQEFQQTGQYLPPQHYLPAQQHSNVMLSQQMQSQGQGQHTGYPNPFMGPGSTQPGPPTGGQVPSGQHHLSHPPGHSLGSQGAIPMSQGQGVTQQGYMPSQSFYSQQVAPPPNTQPQQPQIQHHGQMVSQQQSQLVGQHQQQSQMVGQHQQQSQMVGQQQQQPQMVGQHQQQSQMVGHQQTHLVGQPVVVFLDHTSAVDAGGQPLQQHQHYIARPTEPTQLQAPEASHSQQQEAAVSLGPTSKSLGTEGSQEQPAGQPQFQQVTPPPDQTGDASVAAQPPPLQPVLTTSGSNEGLVSGPPLRSEPSVAELISFD